MSSCVFTSSEVSIGFTTANGSPESSHWEAVQINKWKGIIVHLKVWAVVCELILYPFFLRSLQTRFSCILVLIWKGNCICCLNENIWALINDEAHSSSILCLVRIAGLQNMLSSSAPVNVMQVESLVLTGSEQNRLQKWENSLRQHCQASENKLVLKLRF